MSPHLHQAEQHYRMQSPMLGFAVAVCLLATMDAIVKHLGATVPVIQIVFLRFAAGALFALPLLISLPLRSFNGHVLRAATMRAAILLVGSGSFFFALTRLPLAEAVILAFTSPLFVIVIARLLLGELIRPRAVIAVALGMSGIVLIASGDADQVDQGRSLIGVAAALVAAVSYATGNVLLRKHSIASSVSMVVFTQTAICALLATPVGMVTWQPVDAATMQLFILAGCLGTCGHFLMTWGYFHTPAGKLAPLHFTSFLWALFFGITFFGESLSLTSYIGAAVIVVACIVVLTGARPQN